MTMALEEEAAGVGEDGGAARGDAALGKEDHNPSQELIDLLGRLEFGELVVGEILEELCGEVVDILGLQVFAPGVQEAQAGAVVEDLESAAAVVGVTENAAAGVVGLGGLGRRGGMGLVLVGSGGGLCHFGPRSMEEMFFVVVPPPPGAVRIHLKEKELRERRFVNC